MRMLSVVSCFTLALIFGASLVSQPVAKGDAAGDLHQPSMMIGQLTANAKDLPVQSFDAY